MLRLKSGEEFIWKPVLAGLCTYRDVTENRVDLCDIATMNELLDLQRSNDRRVQEYEQRKQELEARSRR